MGMGRICTSERMEAEDARRSLSSGGEHLRERALAQKQPRILASDTCIFGEHRAAVASSSHG